MLCRIDMENTVQSLREELSFKDQVFQQELQETRTRRQVEISEIGKLNKDYRNNNRNRRGVAAQACDCKRALLRVQFPFEEIKYLIFSFPRSGNNAKYGVEFRHSKDDASKIR